VSANLRGDVGCTTIASNALVYAHERSEASGARIASGAHIYGPFENGFTSQQDDVIKGWGCSDPSMVYDSVGGVDLAVTALKVSKVCGVEIPRLSATTVGSEFIAPTGSCGGHTGDYHFHGGFECFETFSGAHSPQVGVAGSYNFYARFEDYTAQKYPLLDACGGHFGFTPESPSVAVYHYHAQRDAPFTLGCHGPSATNGLVTVAECRQLYTACRTGTTSTITAGSTTITYMRDCPCFDANGLNYGTPTELPAIANYTLTPKVTSYDVSKWSCRSPHGACIKTIAELNGTWTYSSSSTPTSPPPPSPPPPPPPPKSSGTSSKTVAALGMLAAAAVAALA